MAADAAQARPQRSNLTQGPIGRTLLAFALPTLASSILQSLNGTINAIWVGRFLGEGALAATSNSNMVMFLLMAFVFGFGMASTILIGQAFGRREIDAARRVFGTASGSFLLVTILVAIAGWFLSPAILKLLGTPGAAAPLALAYLRVIRLTRSHLPAPIFCAAIALTAAPSAIAGIWT
jgi:Na+-driven multidrug efflux pump